MEGLLADRVIEDITWPIWLSVWLNRGRIGEIKQLSNEFTL
jgi:hypothetical protein